MSNETSRLTPFEDAAAAQTGLTDPSQMMTGSVESAQSGGLFAKLHRAIRGKYTFVVPLMLIFGAGGAAFGWWVLKPLYKSEGMVQLQYELDKPMGGDHSSLTEGMAMYDEVLQTQCAIMVSRTVVDRALTSAEWSKTARGADPVALEKFVKELTVVHPPRTQVIQVVFQDHDPMIAATGTQSIMRSYEHYYNAIEQRRGNDQLKALVSQQAMLNKELIDLRSEQALIGRDYVGTNMQSVFDAKLNASSSIREKLDKAKMAVTLTENKADAASVIDGLSATQIAIYDGQMREKIDQCAKAERELGNLLVPYGENHPKVIEARGNLRAYSTDIDRYTKQYREMQKRIAMNGGADSEGSGSSIGTLFHQSKDALRAEVSGLQKAFDDSQRELNSLAGTLKELKKREDDIAKMTKDKQAVDDRLRLFKLEFNLGGRLNVITYGEVPTTPTKDRRIPMAAAMSILGMCVPLLLMVAIGGIGRRYRFSDEADHVRGLPPLLGILPTLPEQLSDPEQAAIAAHCVHQLRIMLQVNDRPEGVPERKIYMITSPSAGDGKTSLTMALGLSFAASGSRTLVIDCDMAGKGLTKLLKARQSPGLIESLGSGTLQGRVKKTTTRNLYILPIGDADHCHAGSLSPIGIRRVLAEAKKVFDAVVIDTGPVLGSLEAQTIAPVADGVILTIARGQLQSLVEKSVRMLRSVGANINGMVFNRAENRDFQKSVAKASSRSHGQQGPTPTRQILAPEADALKFGPLARSVASFLPTGELLPPPASPAKRPPPKADPSQDTFVGMEPPEDDKPS